MAHAQADSSPRHGAPEAALSSSRTSSAEPQSYQEGDRFLTWRKHVRNLYQQLLHIDLVWESPCAQFLPFVTTRAGVTTQNLLTGTRTGGQEQNYLQLLSLGLPEDAQSLDEVANPYCDATGEVGGYGMAPSTCGVKVERRILHDGDVLAARYMYANPLVLASCSSDGNTYVFDWSRVSLNKFPNDPPRPRAPLPPNELSANPTDEERLNYQKRLRALNAVVSEQERWDKRTGEGQHLLTLTGNSGPSDCLDWCTTTEGRVAAGSEGRVCVWQIGNLSKEAAKTVEPFTSFSLDDEESRVTSLQFCWDEPHVFMSSTSSGSIMYNDVRGNEPTEMFSLTSPATAIAVSPVDSRHRVLAGTEDGKVYFFDLRNSSGPVQIEQLHGDEVTRLEWCPHSPHLFASGGKDANVCVYDHTHSKLVFKHGGHTDTIMDLGWNWQEGSAGQLVSADANAVMVWRPRDFFFTH